MIPFVSGCIRHFCFPAKKANIAQKENTSMEGDEGGESAASFFSTPDPTKNYMYEAVKVNKDAASLREQVWKRTLSLRPRRSSGIPDSITRIRIDPTISLRNTVPIAFA